MANPWKCISETAGKKGYNVYKWRGATGRGVVFMVLHDEFNNWIEAQIEGDPEVVKLTNSTSHVVQVAELLGLGLR